MPYKKKKLESCFDSLEKIVSLRDTLTGAVSNVSTNLEWAVERLEMGRRFDEAKTVDVDTHVELKEGLIQMEDLDVEFINSQYTDSLWETMRMLLPHYKTDK